MILGNIEIYFILECKEIEPGYKTPPQLTRCFQIIQLKQAAFQGYHSFERYLETHRLRRYQC
jgi:hypothetical protein